MSTEDELNEELRSYGYKLDTFALKDSNYQVSRLDGYGGYVATFEDAQDLRTFVKRLAESDNLWCIHLDFGNVDVDRSTGEVTPRDGGRCSTSTTCTPTSGQALLMTLPRVSARPL